MIYILIKILTLEGRDIITLRKAHRGECDEITMAGLSFLKRENGFVLWKEWINRNYNFGEDNPPLSRIVKEVLGID